MKKALTFPRSLTVIITHFRHIGGSKYVLRYKFNLAITLSGTKNALITYSFVAGFVYGIGLKLSYDLFEFDFFELNK